MTTYTEFNKDMFLCNNFDNSSNNVYSKGNTILSTPNSLSKATFYNLTDISNNTRDLEKWHKTSLRKIIDPTSASQPYDISSALYAYLNTNKKTYAEFKNTFTDTTDEWIYTFGQLVYSDINTNLSTDKTQVISYASTYAP